MNCPDTLITVWSDPITEQHGHLMRSGYAEEFWLPVIGPTALLIARRLVAMLAAESEVCIDLDDLAQCMGLTNRQGEHSPFGRAFNRLAMFGLAQRTSYGWCVRTHVPTVPVRLQGRWPEMLRQRHLSVLGITS